MYITFRIIIVCIFFILANIIINNSKIVRKNLLRIIFANVTIVLFIGLSFFPFENLLITFDTPEDAYSYYSREGANDELVIEGTNSTFIADYHDDTNTLTQLIVPKTKDGWKIGIGLYTKRIIQKNSNGIVIYVYQYKNTNDYYITVFDTNGGKAIISDAYNTEFYHLEKNNSSLGKTFTTYYAYISNFKPNYSIIVNDIEILIN